MVKKYVDKYKDLVDYFIIVSQDGEELNIPSEDIEFEDDLLECEVQYGRKFFDGYSSVSREFWKCCALKIVIFIFHHCSESSGYVGLLSRK